MSGWSPSVVPPELWESTVRAAVADGFSYFDWLGCVDEIGRADRFRVVIALRNPTTMQMQSLTTTVPSGGARLASLRGVFPGAGWHEREAAELFGVEFIGGDRRHLLLDDDFEGMPMRKEEVLAARTAVPWPGAKDPGEREASPLGGSPGRRRMVPPGVPEPEVWGDRDPDAPAPDPADVAGSASSARVRRSRR